MADKIREECEEKLTQVTPELNSAIQQLNNLSKYDINELKTLRDPPKALKLLMQAFCILCDIDPVKVKARDGSGMMNDYWLAATGKYFLGNPKLID